MQPSDLYARPAPPSDLASDNFHWSSDAASTIAPEDSVSQLDRRFTGRRRMLGPRPMDAPPVPGVPEEYTEQLRGEYVPPEMIAEGDEDEKSTVVPAEPVKRAAQAVGPLAKARGEGSGGGSNTSGGAIPYVSPSQHPRDNYAQDEDDDDSRPLVPSSGPPTSSSRSAPTPAPASTITPYSRTRGYAALGNDDADTYDDDGGVYAAYSRSRDEDLESKAGMRAVERGSDSSATGSRELAGALSDPVGYLRQSIRGRGGGSRTDRDREGSFYMPNELAFRPPSSSSIDKHPSYPPHTPNSYPLSKIPSLDVAPATDRGANGEQIRPDPLWKRWVWDGTDQERRVWEHKRGVGMQRWPFASWALAVVMTAVLIYELVKMKSYTGSPIQTKPSFNVMIGPSAEVLINLGARFAGCIKYISGVTDLTWTCLQDTNKSTLSSTDAQCTMSDVCGFGGFKIVDGTGGPNQSFRFFVPIFLHAGVVHLLLNMLAQCTSAAQVERMMGTPRFLVVYLASGIFGFALGANFALVGQPSVGASGAIFGTHAALLVDLLAHWKIEYRPLRKLLFLVVEIVIGLGLGWVPGVDNFAHLGGFLMGLLTSILLFPIVHPSRTHKYVFIGLRLLALPLVVVVFVVLVRNFYTGDPATACSWCRYLSCWPTAANNHCKGTGLATYSTSSTLPSVLTILFSTFVLPLL
ncbi:hypothetical protein NBRC10512_005682 [Rhodotorula toruloides]|uniref:Rhomboid-type serine protease n=2 Tax=Rhodotorula toruloides TaxID=5286 RepID=A0A061AH82_RHOTO|nr:Rhomboid family protein [Rhodotorula toruloides NP11]EMS19071.1 Rhomboid family protein [Rhodotorula toruloides NP11]CDR36928.1 RHTO0S02e08658g1_1 [Rhodotorula toruloides]